MRLTDRVKCYGLMLFEREVMTVERTLFLHEEVMLLALRDREGTIASGTMYQYAVGGAVLAELLLQGRVEIEQVRKKKFLKLIDSTPMGDDVIDQCLAKIQNARRRAVLQTWVSRFAGVRDLKHIVARGLCRCGILQAREEDILLFFKRNVYPEVDPEPENAIIARLEEAIFTDNPDIDARTVVLLSLAKSAELLKVVFDKKSLKVRKLRIEQVSNGEVTGRAAKEAIEAMQAAVMVAVIMPAIICSTSST